MSVMFQDGAHMPILFTIIFHSISNRELTIGLTVFVVLLVFLLVVCILLYTN